MSQDALSVGVTEKDDRDSINENDVLSVYNEVINRFTFNHLRLANIFRVHPLSVLKDRMSWCDSQSTFNGAEFLNTFFWEHFNYASNGCETRRSSNLVAFFKIFDHFEWSISESDKRLTCKATATIVIVIIVVSVIHYLLKLNGSLWSRNLNIQFFFQRCFWWVQLVIDVISCVGEFIEEFSTELSQTWISEIALDLNV